MKMQNTSYRKWGIGLGLLAASLLSGYLALRPAKKMIIQGEGQPAGQSLPKTEEKPKSYTWERIIDLKTGPQSMMPEEAASHASLAKQKAEIKNLNDFFEQLNDNPLPIFDFDESVRVETEGVCIWPGFYGNVALYGHGKFLGFLNDRSSPFFSSVSYSLLNEIINSREEPVGFLRETPLYMSSTQEFVSRGGIINTFVTLAGSEISKDEKEGETLIGKFNEEKNQFEEEGGNILGRLSQAHFYVPIFYDPGCEIYFEDENRVAGFLRFNSKERVEKFVGYIESTTKREELEQKDIEARHERDKLEEEVEDKGEINIDDNDNGVERDETGRKYFRKRQ